MGLHGRSEHPDVQSAIARIEQAVQGSKVVLGGVAANSDQARAMIDRGWRALMIGFDWSLLQRGIAMTLDGIDRAA